MPRGDQCWKDWAIELRKRMYRDKCSEITLTIDEIAKGTGADMTREDLCSRSFWSACRDAKEYFDTIPRQGLQIDFDPTAEGKVQEVTFRLDAKRLDHFQRVVLKQDNKTPLA